MPPGPESIVAAFEPIELAELNRAAALRNRIDNKYIVDWSLFERLAAELVATHSALEIAGRRMFGYTSVYFDTDSLLTYRAHVQRRRKRFKCRSRHYVDSGLSFFEVKLKGSRGETVKRQMPYESGHSGTVTTSAAEFVRESLRTSYEQDFTCALHPRLRTDYRRITLAFPSAGERLTCDFDLRVEDEGGGVSRMRSEFLIVESKSRRGRGLADRVLLGLGAKPLVNCSKYCLGISLTRSDVKSNEFRWLTRRFFEPGLAAA